MKMSILIRCSAFMCVSFLLTMFVRGDAECELFLKGSENNYLAQSTLRSVFASFQQIFNTAYSSDSIKRKLDEKAVRFAELLLVAKRIELELKALDENKLNRTIEDLCHESAPNDLWSNCTYVVLRTEFELQNLLRQALNEPDVIDVDYRPRPG